MLSQLSRVYQVTVPTLQFDHFQSWYGMFSTLNILIGARLYDQNGSIYFYEVLDNGRLILVDEESQIMLAAKQLPVRVIARLDKNIYIDLSPLIVNFSSHILVLNSKPIDDLQWIQRIMVGNCPCLTLRLRSFLFSNIQWRLAGILC